MILGWRDTSLYGSKFYETPNVDALGRRGITFSNAYSASPLCSPSRSAILTGLWPARTGITRPSCHIEEVILEKDVWSHAGPQWKSIDARTVTRLKLEYVTLADALKLSGYATAHFGKWHLGREPYDPLHHGFEIDIPHWFGPSPPAYIAPWHFSDWKATPWRVPYDDGKPGEDIEDRMGDEAVKFIRAHKDVPFFANYWCYSVHSPWQSLQPLVEKYRKKADFHDPQHNPVMGAMIEVMDRNIGKLIRAVDELGLRERTIFVFFSDNGGVNWADLHFKGYENTPLTSNAPLRGGKETLYEGGTREPLVVVWPGVTRPGSKSDAVVSGVDFFPTLANACGARVPKKVKFDGLDIRPALEGGKLSREAVYCHFPHYGGLLDEFPGSWVRKGDWKLHPLLLRQPGPLRSLRALQSAQRRGRTERPGRGDARESPRAKRPSHALPQRHQGGAPGAEPGLRSGEGPAGCGPAPSGARRASQGPRGRKMVAPITGLRTVGESVGGLASLAHR